MLQNDGSAIVSDAQQQDSMDLGDLKDLEACELRKKKRYPQAFPVKGPWRHEVQVVKNEATSTWVGHFLRLVSGAVVILEPDGVARWVGVQVADREVVVIRNDSTREVDEETVGVR